jgi:general secretion pathway protein D
MVEVEAQFVRATAAQMQEALGARQPLEPRSILTPEQLKKAVASLERSKASFFGRPRAVTVSGQRAVVEAVRELRYPTEFDPGTELPRRFTPTAFETRNVGVTLEFEPIADPDGQVILNVVPSVVTFLGFVD